MPFMATQDQLVLLLLDACGWWRGLFLLGLLMYLWQLLCAAGILMEDAA
jgi:hypothetical protein